MSAIHDPADLAALLPPKLRLGTATSSYQIEGAVHDDGRGQSIWDTYCATPGMIEDDSSGAIACDHYNRWRDDLDLMADLGMQVYRFSIAWPRIQPTGHGPAEPRGLDFYDSLVDGLLDRGIEPVPTLYHWDLPQTLEDQGGWPSRDLAGRFADYASIVVERLGDRVTRWATLNEPWCTAHLGYHSGEHAPGRKDAGQAMAAAYTLLRAHGLADQAIRAASSTAQVGAAVNVTALRGRSEEDADGVRALDAIRNRWWLDGIIDRRLPEDAVAAWASVAEPDIRDGDLCGARPDWLGINYYYPELVTVDRDGAPYPDACVEPARAAPQKVVTTMGWPVDASGFGELLRRVHTDYGPLPLVITENGAAFDDDDPVNGRLADPQRTAYLSSHLEVLAGAVADGVQVTDYMAWSFMDNFEWARGYGQRFGIVHVDYDTQARTPKDSARWYAELIQALASR